MLVSRLSAEGALEFVPALRASEQFVFLSPALRAGLLTPGPSDLKHTDD